MRATEESVCKYWRYDSSVRLTSAPQGASSVICYAAMLPPVIHGGIFFIPHSVVQLVFVISSVHTLSVYLASSLAPNDYFTSYLCSLLEVRFYFNILLWMDPNQATHSK